MDNDPLTPARGCMNAVLLTLAFGIFIIVIILLKGG